jgi:hypothetical protein
MSRVLKGAGIPLQVWPENSLPSPEAAREAILRELHGHRPAESAAPAQTVATSNATASAALTAAASQPPQKPASEPALPGATRHFDRDTQPDEIIEMLEPPPSTWFDDLDSGPTPLGSEKKATASH